MAVVKILIEGKWQVVTEKPWTPEKASAIADGLRRYGFKAKSSLA